MPSEASQLVDSINRLHTQFKEVNDKAIKEREQFGQELSETREKLETLEDTIQTMSNQLAQSRKENRIKVHGLTMLTPDDLTEEQKLHRAAFEHYVRFGIGEKARRPMMPEQLHSLAGTSDQDGGFLVPPDFDSDLVMAIYNAAELRPYTQRRTTSRDRVQVPSLQQVQVTWGRRGLDIDPQKLESGGSYVTICDQRGLVTIANDTLDDAETDIYSELREAFGMALAESEDDSIAAGAAPDRVSGIVSNPDVQARFIPSGVANDISDSSHNGIDALTDMHQNIKKGYRRNGIWAFNSATEGKIRKLKNDNGDYLWSPPVAADRPATLLGRSVANPEGMPDVAAGTYPVFFGNLRQGYRLYDRAGISVRRLDELFAKADETGFIVKRRVGGQVVLPEAFTVLKIATAT